MTGDPSAPAPVSAGPAEAAEPELAPYLIEEARSSRSRCRTCRKKIEKGKLRLGIVLEGPYGSGYIWHHLNCAAKRRLEDVEAAYAQPAFDEGLKVPSIEKLRGLQEKAEKERAERKELPYVEKAPTGRSKCKHCGEGIEQDSFRVVLGREVEFGSQVRTGPINVHAKCVVDELDAEDCATAVEGFAEALHAHSGLDAATVDAALVEIGPLD